MVFGGELQEKGCIFELTVNNAEDLNRYSRRVLYRQTGALDIFLRLDNVVGVGVELCGLVCQDGFSGPRQAPLCTPLLLLLLFFVVKLLTRISALAKAFSLERREFWLIHMMPTTILLCWSGRLFLRLQAMHGNSAARTHPFPAVLDQLLSDSRLPAGR